MAYLKYIKIFISYGIYILVGSSTLYAQKEAANWYFGTNAGLNFLNGIPEPLLDGALDTLEGCATISDESGNLLFYTDGIAIWNRNHRVMPNGFGLLGSFSATQSAVIVPKPGESSIYYVFTSDVVQAYQDGGTGNGLNYSVVDMNANGGLGDVIEINNSLLPQTSEKLTGVYAADGENIWILTHHHDSFYAYLVTSNGVITTPVISTLGFEINDPDNIRGAIKISPNGKRLAVAHTVFDPAFGGGLYLYDFNTETGIVSNEIAVEETYLHYGVEFSSNSKLLYSTAKNILTTNTTGETRIFQFELESLDVASTRKEIAVFDTTISDLAGQLQLAIDRRIYHSIPDFSLSVIKEPNLVGAAADFREFDLFLENRALFGLPPFIQSFFESVFDASNVCLDQEVEFNLTIPDEIVSVLWNFGDPGSGNNSSTMLQPTHVFSGPGTFFVTVEIDFQDKPDRTYSQLITILGPPSFIDVELTGVVGNQIATVLVSDPENYVYSIDGGETFQESQTFDFLTVGFYTIEVWGEGCLLDSITFNVGGLPNFFTPNGDGYHDVWKIPGGEKVPTYTITIYDRYGKVLKQIENNEIGWDGTYEGRLMPSNDYWYVVEFEDGQLLKGNFTLKR